MAGRSTFLRRRMGRRAKQLRERTGLTLTRAAEKLEMDRSALGRIERGETYANVHLARSMMDVYDQRDDELLEMARAAAKKDWWHAYGVKNFGYIELESEADAIREYGGMNIPGLLQTEAYMAAQLRAGLRRTDRELATQIRVRLIRQLRLTATDDPLSLTAIIDEAALLRPVGGQAVLAEQLRHLVTLSDLPTVDLRLLPFSIGAHEATASGFTLLSFPYPDEPDMLYISHPAGSHHIEAAAEVSTATLVFDRLYPKTLSGEETVRRIEQLVTDL